MFCWQKNVRLRSKNKYFYNVLVEIFATCIRILGSTNLGGLVSVDIMHIFADLDQGN